MTDREPPMPGQGPEAWRAGGAGAPDLLELQATDALLDRIALRLPTPDDLDDPMAAALVALAAEVDAGRPVERRNGRGGTPYGANGYHGTSNGHAFGYADLRPGVNGHRPQGPDGRLDERASGRLNGHVNGNTNGYVNGHVNGRRPDDLEVEDYEVTGAGGDLRTRPERPASLGEWTGRLVELATRKPLAVLGAAAATVGIIFGALLVGQNFSPLPTQVGPGSPAVSESQLAGINSALGRADRAAQQGQVGSARKALQDAEAAVAQLPQSPAKESFRKKIEKMRLKVEKTAVPSAVTSGPRVVVVVTTPAAGTPGVTTTPTTVTTAPTTAGESPTATTSPTGSPTTTVPTTSPVDTQVPGGDWDPDPDPTETSTEPGVTPVSSGAPDDPTVTTAP